MHPGVARLLLSLWPCWLAGCGHAELTPSQSSSHPRHDAQIEREQRALDRRLLQLENRALSELRAIRENRQASTGAAQPPLDQKPASKADSELLVFGGAHHEVFLGCLCDERHSDSVFNMLGQHGSHLSPASIRNKFAPYGSNHDATSACNVTATRPPVVLASDGTSIGLLTLNESLKRRISAPSVTDWLTRMCRE